jgi:hypothetical protein
MGGCIAAGAAVGAVTGLVGGVAGKVIATVGSKIAGAVISRISSKLAAGEQNVIRDVVESCPLVGNSFAAGTLVLMADGTKKPIEQLKPGDMVMAGDPESGIERPEPVQRVIVGHGLKHLYDIQVADEMIEATYNHPFWVIETQSYVWAQDLVPGQHMLLADGRAPPITAISHHDEITTVYNLSIEDIHTFYVGQNAVLVHNCGGGLARGMVGKFKDLDKMAKVGDDLTPHHMPQAALGFTSREDGISLMLQKGEHALTRSYGPKGAVTKALERDLPFRNALARDLWDLRGISREMWRAGVKGVPAMYRELYPELIAKV